MTSKRTDRPKSRPMTSDEMLHFEEDIVQGGNEPAAGDAPGEPPPEEDRLTKSGRLRIEDVQNAEPKGPRSR